VLDLDGRFGLHPALSAFQPLWQQGHLAIVHAAGSPDTTRSHFDRAGFHGEWHSGREGPLTMAWLNRSLRNLPPARQNSPFRAIALGPVIAANAERRAVPRCA